jgi:hypothetical protein
MTKMKGPRCAPDAVALRLGYQPDRIVRQHEALGDKIVGRFPEGGDIILFCWITLIDRETGIRGRTAFACRRIESCRICRPERLFQLFLPV